MTDVRSSGPGRSFGRKRNGEKAPGMQDIGVMLVGFESGVGSMIARMFLLLGVRAASIEVAGADGGDAALRAPSDIYQEALHRAASADVDLLLLRWPDTPPGDDNAALKALGARSTAGALSDDSAVVAFVKAIRASANALQPIVAAVGARNRRGLAAAVAAGVHECLTTPLSAERLKDCIDRHVLSAPTMVKTAGYFGPDRRRD